MLHPRRSRGCRGSTFWWGSTSPFVKTAQKHLAPCLVVVGDDVTSRASVYMRRGSLRDNQRGSRVSEAAGSGTHLHTARFPVVRKQFPYRTFKITFTRFFSVCVDGCAPCTAVEVRGQSVPADSRFLPCWCQGSNSGLQA